MKKTSKRLLSYVFRPYKFRLSAVMLSIVMTSLSFSATSIFLGILVDDYITPMLGGADLWSELIRAVLILLCIYLGGMVGSFLQSFLMVKVTQGVLRTIRNEMFSHMQSLPVRYFDANSYGDVMSHYTNDTDSLRMMISQGIPNVLSSLATIIVVLVAMCFTSFRLTLITLVFVALKAFVGYKLGGKSSKHFIGQQRSLGKLNGYVEEMISGQKVVKVFCHEKEAEADFARLNNELFENAANANKYANVLMPVLANLGHLLYIVIAIAGGAMAVGGVGSLTLGTIITFLQLARSFNMPMNQIAQQINSIVMSLAGAERVFDLLDEEPERDDGFVTLVNAKPDGNGELTETEERTGVWAWKIVMDGGSPSYVLLRGDVRFFDVNFAYSPEKPVLHDVSLFAKPGQKLAFVGATGAGKTTITNLINRFYDISDGKIYYDNIDIRKIRKPDLRRSLGVVLQDVNLFTGTIMDNIRYGRLDATDEECIEAAKEANAHGFISLLPDGYDTFIEGDGSHLSQGQCQLLSIARCAVANPPVMILDEATSTVDTRTERIVQRGMDKLMEGRTVLVIAHRLSTVMNADAIMVLDHGRIIERGAHEQLIEAKGTYYKLYTGAFELE